MIHLLGNTNYTALVMSIACTFTLLPLLLLLSLYGVTNAALGRGHATWRPDYIEAVLNARQCLNETHIALLDSLFAKMVDMELIKLYYARGLSFFSNRIQRGRSVCTALVETASEVYRDVQWGRQEAINWQFHEEEKKIREEAKRETMKNGGSMAQASVASKQARASQNARRQKALMRDMVREPTMDHIQKLLADNALRPQCDRLSPTPEQLTEMKECLRRSRKEAIPFKITFSPPTPPPSAPL